MKIAFISEHSRGSLMSLIGRSSAVRLAGVAVLLTLAAVVWLVVVEGGSPARATLADGDVVLGLDQVQTNCRPGTDVNCSSNPTGVVGSGGGLVGRTGGSGYGVEGDSLSGPGIGAFSSSDFGLFAQSGAATGGHVETLSQFGAGLEVQINNSSTTMPNRRGALEAITKGSGQGVLATAISGPGVEGHSTSGAGLLGVADSAAGTALKAQGKTTLSGPTTLGGTSSFTGATSFARSGKLTISKGTSQATKSAISLGSSSLVLATIQGNQPGVYVQGVTIVSGSSGSFTIHLNANTPINLPAAWLVLN